MIMGRGAVAGAFLALVLISCGVVPSTAAEFNVTLMLRAYPRLSQFNQLLSSSGVADEINSRSSITILAVANPVLSAFMALYPTADAGQVGDLLRYHVLLQYLNIPELNTITAGNPSTVTTLFQATGRASGNSGSVNLYNDGTTLSVGLPDPTAPANATIVTNVTQIPYNISILEITNVVAPVGFGAPVAAAANLSAILESGGNFKTLIGLLAGTGVDAVFASKQTGTGITIFAPDDSAFAALAPSSLASITPAQQKLLLEYHALTAYYPLGTLMTLNDPAAPTLATGDGGPNTYLLNVSNVAGTVTLGTGFSTASITSTLYDTQPTIVFAIGSVLLPTEIFLLAGEPTPAPAPAPTNGSVPAPAPAPINGSVPAPAPAPINGSVPAPAPAPVNGSIPSPAPAPTPTTTPSPTPTLTPTPAPAPSPRSPSPSPVPAVSPGPPAPPLSPPTTGSEGPAESPEAPPPPSGASTTTFSVVLVSGLALVSSAIVLL